MITWYRKDYNTFNADLISGGVIGLFYNSYDKLRHIAHYEPYKMTPSKSLCNCILINFTSTGSKDNICSECLSIAETLVK